MITQALVPVHPPDHPENAYPAVGVAVSVTDEPVSKFAEHVDPQLIPDGELVIVPLPGFVTDIA